MKEKLCFFVCLFAIAILLTGCPVGRAYDDDLGNGYAVMATDVMKQAEIVKKHKESPHLVSVAVPATVFAYGWNDDFILAKRHPQKKDGKVDTSITHWYIVEVASGKVHGPLSEDEFNKLRTKLKVPAEISFKTIKWDFKKDRPYLISWESERDSHLLKAFGKWDSPSSIPRNGEAKGRRGQEARQCDS